MHARRADVGREPPDGDDIVGEARKGIGRSDKAETRQIVGMCWEEIYLAFSAIHQGRIVRHFRDFLLQASGIR
ncbi:hypothetical protein [Devosia sp.]|uniref:hypothetical protein n=1 Tax=Devosia sp. TaxID=1871048 RepID=UPI001AD2BA48|nr:hypothetical protein [Devosia sp.]MBN9333726.1 hypothetical protein [Devosia sp.]